MDKQEVLSKIEKIKANSALPEKQRGQLLDKYNSLLAELEKAEKPEKPTKNANTKKVSTKKNMVAAVKNISPKSKKTSAKIPVPNSKKVGLKHITIHWAEGTVSKYDKFPKNYTTWEVANKAVLPIYYDNIKDGGGGYNKVKFTVVFTDGEKYDGRLDVSEKEDNPTKTKNVFGTHIKEYLDWQLSNKSDTPESTKKEIREYLEKYDLGLGEKSVPKKVVKEPKIKSISAKKVEPKKSESKSPDYDCEQLIKEVKEKRKKAKEAASKRANAPKKTEATKVKESIEKVSEKIEKKYEAGKLTKVQILNLIMRLKKEIKELEKLLKTAK